MLTSKRQEWILQMIKGPDIAPVSNCPGHYTSKNTICVIADDRQVTIQSADVLDLSNPEFLVVQKNGNQSMIRWDRITSLEFDEPVMTTAAERRHVRATADRFLYAGKKAV